MTGLTLFCLIQMLGVLFYTYVNIWYMQFLAELIGGIMGGVSMAFIMSTTVVADDSRDYLDSVILLFYWVVRKVWTAKKWLYF